MLTAVAGTADHVPRNCAVWDRWAASYAGPGLRMWTASELMWGIWNIAEAQAGVLPADLAGRDRIELGCGTGYVSAWLARRAAGRAGQLRGAAGTACRLQDRFGLRFPLMHASAEQVAFADASFDLAISEYGANRAFRPGEWPVCRRSTTAGREAQRGAPGGRPPGPAQRSGGFQGGCPPGQLSR